MSSRFYGPNGEQAAVLDDAGELQCASNAPGSQICLWASTGVPVLRGVERKGRIEERWEHCTPADPLFGLAFYEYLERLGWRVETDPTANAKGVSGPNCGTGAGGFKPGNTCAKGGKGLPNVPAIPEFVSSNKAAVESNEKAAKEMQELAKAGDLAGLKAHPGTPSPKLAAWKAELEAKLEAHQKSVMPPAGFPENLADLQYVSSLKGSTGAKKFTNPATGENYVLKQGTNPGHIASEDIAANAYAAAGLDVPKGYLYETDQGPVRATQFLEGGKEWGQLTAAEQAKHRAELIKGFAVDAALGNRDVLGMGNDNVMVANGKVYRIDVGGSMAYRAQGEPKGDAWTKDPTDFHSMRNATLNPQTAAVFGTMTDDELVSSIGHLTKHKEAILKTLPDDLRETVSARIAKIEELGGSIKINKTLADYETAKKGVMSAGAVTAGKAPSLGSSADLKAHVQSHIGGTKFKDEHIQKIAFLNPEGVKDGVFYMPLMGATKSDPANAQNIEHMSKVLPAGTQIVGVYVAKTAVNSPDVSIVGGKVMQGGVAIDPKKVGVVGLTSKSLKESTGELAGGAGVSSTGGGAFKIAPLPTHLTPTPVYSMPPPEVPLSATHKSWTGLLSPAEDDAIDRWKHGGQLVMRIAMGNDPPPPPKGSDPAAARAREFYNGMLKGPKFVGTTYRGISDDWATEQVQLIKKAGVGGIYSDAATHCTSRNLTTGKSFAGGHTLFKIDIKSGRPIEHIHNYHGEQEVVGMAGVKYRIKSMSVDMDVSHPLRIQYGVQNYIELEEIIVE